MLENNQPQTTARQTQVWLLIAVLSLSGGCCTPKRFVACGALNRALYKISHWQENRCLCEPPSTCHLAPVTYARPTGYLSDGATLSGAVIAGEPEKQATDVIVGLDERIRSLEDANARLNDNLLQANQVIQNQSQQLLTAQGELRLATDEHQRVQAQMRRWHTALNELDAKYRSSQRRYDSSLADMEQRLRDMLKSRDGSDDFSSPPSDPLELMDET